MPGVYVPSRDRLAPRNGTLVKRQWARNLDDFATTSTVLTPDTELGGMYLIEIARGCSRGCRFCLAGYAFRPMRSRSLKNLLAQAAIGLNFRKRLGLMGAAVSDHPEIEELVIQLRKMGALISLSSLRMESVPETVLQALAESGTRTVTMAPEAGSERLRLTIKKGITNYDVLEAVDKVAKHGLKQLKLYFIVGLPTETDDDIEDLIKLTLACKELVDKRKAATRLTIVLSPFIPKAGTPFQWLPMAKPDVLNHRLSRIKNSLRPQGIEVKAESVGWSLVQGALARGDSRLGAALTRMQETSLPAWRRALEDCHLDLDFYVHRELPPGEALPWSALDSGVDRRYLELELRRAEESSATSAHPPQDYHRCEVCR